MRTLFWIALFVTVGCGDGEPQDVTRDGSLPEVGRDTGGDSGEVGDTLGDTGNDLPDAQGDVADTSDAESILDAPDAADASDTADAGDTADAPDTPDAPMGSAPSADAGLDQEVSRGARVHLRAAASTDPDGDELEFVWTQLSGEPVVLEVTEPSDAAFTAPAELGELRFEVTVTDGTFSDSASVVVTVQNGEPQALIAPPGVVPKGSEVQLDASASSDPDGDELTWSWEQVSGPEVTLEVDGDAALFTAPRTSGPIVVRVTVSDGLSQDTAEAEVFVRNDPPSVLAGPDQQVSRGGWVQMQAFGEDPDDDDIRLQWTQAEGPEVTLDDPASPTPSFVAPELPTELSFSVVADDGEAQSAPARTVILVVNRQPEVRVPDRQSVHKGEEVELSAVGFDRDDDDLTWSWRQNTGAPVDLEGADSPTPRFTAPRVSGLLIFEAVASDPWDTSDPGLVSVQVINRRPTATAGEDIEVTRGRPVQLQGTAADPDSDPLVVRWTQRAGPRVALANGDSLTPSFQGPDVAGVLMFDLDVTDGEDPAPTTSVTVTVTNQAPVASAGPDQEVLRGETVMLDGTGSSDPDDDAISYVWRQRSGPGVSLIDGDTARPRFDTHERLGVAVFELEVSDGLQTATDEVAVEITTRRPVAQVEEDFFVNKGEIVRLDGMGSDPDGDPLTFLWTQESGPAIELSDPEDPRASFTVGNQSGFIVLSLVVSDGGRSSDPVQLTIEVVNRAPIADAGPDFQDGRGRIIVLDGSASYDRDPEELSYEWTYLGDGNVEIDDAFAAIATVTTPDGLATLRFQLEVTDPEGAAARDTVVVQVINLPPEADAGDDQTTAVGSSVDIDGCGSRDPEGAPLSYNWTQISGPTVQLDPDECDLSVTAGPVGGDAVLRLTVSDGQDEDQDDVTVTVSNEPAVVHAGEGGAWNRAPVQIAGSATDPEGFDLHYLWERVSGPQVSFDDSTSLETSFAVTGGGGELVLRLSATDPGGVVGSAEVRFTAPEGFDADRVNPFTYPSWVTQNPVRALAASPTTLYAVAGLDLLLFDRPSPLELLPAQAPSFDGAPVMAVTFHAGQLFVVTQGDTGRLHILDAADPLAPPVGVVELSSRPGDDERVGISVSGTLVSVAGVGGRMSLVDITEPTSPVEVSTMRAHAALLDGDIAYVGDFVYLYVYDVSTPATPTQLHRQQVTGTGVFDISLSGDTLAIGTSNTHLFFDVTNPAQPVSGESELSYRFGLARFHGDRVILARVESDYGLTLWNIDEPGSREHSYSWPRSVHGQTTALALADDSAFLGAGSRIVAFDLQRADSIPHQDFNGVPHAMERDGDTVVGRHGSAVGTYSLDEPFALVRHASLDGAFDLDLRGTALFAVAGNLLTIYDVSDPEAPATVSTLLPGFTANRVSVSADLAILAGEANDRWLFRRFDVSNLEEPSSAGNRYFLDPQPRDLVEVLLDGTTLWLLTNNELQTYDVSGIPVLLAQRRGFYESLQTTGNAIIAASDEVVEVFAADAPGNLTPLSSAANLIGASRGLEAEGALLALWDNGTEAYQVLDVSDPGRIRTIAGARRVSNCAGLVMVEDENIWEMGCGIRFRVREAAELTERFEEALPGAVVTYNLVNVRDDAELACVVSGGTCDVVARDLLEDTATLEWATPLIQTEHELLIIAGDPARWEIVGEDRVHIR